MMNPLLIEPTLVFFRLLPIFVVAPVSSFNRVPMMVRLVLTLSLAIILAGALPDNPQLNNNLFHWGMFVSEFLIGASLAFSFHAASGALHTMGQLTDLQIGFAAGAVFDPNTEQMASITGEMFTLTFLVCLVILNIHHELLIGFAALLTILPPGSTINWSAQWLQVLGVHFTIGFIIVSPVIVTLWFMDLTLAFISRSLPQAQIYFVGLPVKIFVGILVLSWFIGQALEPFMRMFTQSLNSWGMMFDT